VLGIYLVGAWLAFQGIEALVSGLGLPERVPGLAVVLLIVGLPIVLATAFVQEGVGEKEAPAEAPAVCEASEATITPTTTAKVMWRLYRYTPRLVKLLRRRFVRRMRTLRIEE
jgi:hypothetical protein